MKMNDATTTPATNSPHFPDMNSLQHTRKKDDTTTPPPSPIHAQTPFYATAHTKTDAHMRHKLRFGVNIISNGSQSYATYI